MYALRPANVHDAVSVTALFAAQEQALFGRAFSIEDDFSSPRPRFEWERDSWVLTTPSGTIVVYGEVWEREAGRRLEAIGVVDPKHTGRGLGAMLLEITEGRARQLSQGTIPKLRNVVPSGDDRAARLMTASGYELVRRYQHMAIELDPDSGPGESSGIAVRAFEPDRDMEPVHKVIQTAFAETWEFHPTSFDQWGGDPPKGGSSLWFVAAEGDEVVGAVTATTRSDYGWINELAVLPSRRGQGIGSALMRRAFDAFRKRGTARVELNVDSENPTGAARLYEQLGMSVVRYWDLYDKVLSSSSR